jgi:glucosamine--fructose-6-phosphate aminotransferase (isomerizing)
MNATERGIREQFSFWRAAPAAAFTADAETIYAVVGCGTSVHIADSIAVTLCHRGITARAVPGNEWARRPGDYLPGPAKAHVLALSRSGESTETVNAARLSREAGLSVTGFTCTAGSALTQVASTVVFAETHPEEDIVMTSSASLMLLMGLRFAGVDVDADAVATAAEGAMQALDAGLQDALQGRTHFVFLGGGPLFGIAREGALKLQEMSLSHTEAHHPLEYRHGPVSLIDGRSLVVVLYHPETADEEAVLAAELQAKGAFVIGFGGPGDIAVTLPPDLLTRGLVCLPALQLLGERVALARGLDSTAPRHLTKVVLTP